MSLREGFGVGFRWVGGGGFPLVNVGKGEGGGEGTSKGTGKSMRTRLSKLLFRKLLTYMFAPAFPAIVVSVRSTASRFAESTAIAGAVDQIPRHPSSDIISLGQEKNLLKADKIS